MAKTKFISTVLILISFIFNLNAQTHTAVIDFSGKNVSSTNAASLTERLRAELFSTKRYIILERDRMDEILKEQEFQISGCTTNECFIEIGKLLNVEQLIIGSISQVGSTYSISARIISVETGEILTVATYDYEGKIDDLLTRGMKIVALKLSGKAISTETTKEQQNENLQIELSHHEDNLPNKIISPSPLKTTKLRMSKSNEIYLSIQTSYTGNSSFASNTQNIWQVYIIGTEISKFFIFQYGISNTIAIEKVIPFKGEFINKAEINYWIADGMVQYPFKMSKRFVIIPSCGYLYSSIVFSSEESDKIKFINSGMINQIKLKYIVSPVTISIHVSKLLFAKYDNWSGTGINLGFLF